MGPLSAPLALLALAAVTAAGSPAPASRVYRDDQGRFALTLPAGWQYAPLTTNFAGAMFRGERPPHAFAEASVTVIAFDFPISQELFSARTLEGFAQEPGFQWRDRERACQVAGHPGRCRSFFLAGPPGRKIVRVIEQRLVVVEQAGYVAHCETEDEHFHAFKDDCRAIFADLRLRGELLPEPHRQRPARPLAPGQLVGHWRSPHHQLQLTPGGIVDLDGHQGTWRLGPGVLILALDGHEQVVTVEHRPGTMVLGGGPFGAAQTFVATRPNTPTP